MKSRESSPFVLSAPFPEGFAKHLREAVSSLGYYHDQALDELETMYRDRWRDGISATMLNREEVMPLLSDKGQRDIIHAQKATFLRATFNLRREEFDATEPQWSSFCSRVQFNASALLLCDRARSLNGIIVDRAQRWSLPMAGCDEEWCPCRWDHVPDE